MTSAANSGFAAPTAFLVLAITSALLGMIATIAYVWAAVLGVMALAGFVIARGR